VHLNTLLEQKVFLVSLFYSLYHFFDSSSNVIAQSIAAGTLIQSAPVGILWQVSKSTRPRRHCCERKRRRTRKLER
jgi:hypothetical protein